MLLLRLNKLYTYLDMAPDTYRPTYGLILNTQEIIMANEAVFDSRSEHIESLTDRITQWVEIQLFQKVKRII